MAKKKKKALLNSIDKAAKKYEKKSDPADGTGVTRAEEIKRFPKGEVQSIIPIKQIYKGMIVTEDDRYIKILEVLPINFALRSNEEQDNIIHLFAGWLRVAPIKMQFKIVTRKADSFEIVNNVKTATAKETHPKCRELADNYIDFIERLSEQEALTRRFFIIYEYETISSREKTIDDIAIEMEEMARKIRGNLAACGNEVVTPQNEEYFQAEILYQFYNRQSCVTEQLADRVLRVTDDVMKEKGLVEGVDEYPDIPIPDYIAPRGVDFTNPDYFICDGLYQTILYVQRNGYPTAVNGGWLSSIIESSDGIDIDIILRRQSKANIRDSGAIRCVFLTPPMTKSRAAANRFFEIFCVDLQKKIVANMPQNFRKIEDAYVFFIHHFDETDPHKQPYFDNDNLAIKSILDSVLPFICFDDASCYCSNLYLSQPDSRDYSEFVVIQKSRAKQWILQRTDLQFSRDFL